jgi:hypothetical protein
MRREVIRDNRCPACGGHTILSEDERDFCLLCPWEREHDHQPRYPWLALRLADLERDATDAA